jgi:hypothetical protein
MIYSRANGEDFSVYNNEEMAFLVEKINEKGLPNTGWICINIKTDQKGYVTTALLKREDNSRFMNVEVNGQFPVLKLHNEGRMVGNAVEIDVPHVVHIEPNPVVMPGQFSKEVEKKIEKIANEKLFEKTETTESTFTVETEEGTIVGEVVAAMIDKYDTPIVEKQIEKVEVIEEVKATTLSSLPTKTGKKAKK